MYPKMGHDSMSVVDNRLRSVWLKLPPSDGINRNSNDEWMPRYPLHADDISLRVNKNRQDNGSTYVKHIRAAWSLNRLCLFHQSPTSLLILIRQRGHDALPPYQAHKRLSC